MKKYKKLCEVCDINMGQSPDSNSYNTEQKGIPFFQGNADFGELYPYVRMWCNSPKKIVEQGTLLISVRAPIGALNFASEKSCIGRGLAGITARSDIELKYIYYCLKAKRGELNRKGTGSTFKAISKNVLGGIEIEYISLDAQKKCSAILDKLNEVIRKKKKQIEYADELIKSRFIEMFGDCIINPKGWKTRCLEEIAEVGSSKRVFVEELQETGIPFYRGTEIGALAEGKKITPQLFVTENHYEELCRATGTPQIGDLLMPSICPDGRIWMVNTDEPFYFKDGRVLWIHAIDSNYNPVFLLYTLKDRIMTDYSNIASGTTFAELKIFALKKCQIFDVPIALQNEFAAFVDRTDKSKLLYRYWGNFLSQKEKCFCLNIICTNE